MSGHGLTAAAVDMLRGQADAGVPVKSLALRFGLTPRQVRGILAAVDRQEAVFSSCPSNEDAKSDTPDVAPVAVIVAPGCALAAEATVDIWQREFHHDRETMKNCARCGAPFMTWLRADETCLACTKAVRDG